MESVGHGGLPPLPNKFLRDLGELYGMKKLIYNNLHTLAF